jgi:AsmA protein
MSRNSRKSRRKAARFLEFPMRGRIYAAIATALFLAIAAAAWLVLSPRWAVTLATQQAQQALGRQLTVSGGAHLSLSPLSIRLDGVAVSGAGTAEDSFLTAKAAIIPLSVAGFVAHAADLSTVRLEGAEFALLIDERGATSWDLPDPIPGQELTLILDNASWRFFDARNGQSLTLRNIDGTLRAGSNGIEFQGRAVIANRVVRIDAALKSLSRVSAGGSPLDVAVETDQGSASFSGRISTEKVLSLTGPVSLAAQAPADMIRNWGIPVPGQWAGPSRLNIDGGLDTAGRAYAIRNAALTLGTFRAAGDVVVDLRNAVPKLQAALKAPSLVIDAIMPDSGATGSDWGRAPLGFSVLRGFDAELVIDADAARYGPLATGAARVTATLAGGKLDTAGAARLGDGGSIAYHAAIDATATPASGELSIKAENTELGIVLGALTGLDLVHGMGTASATLAGSGQTQEELIGTLKGTASIAASNGTIIGADAAATLRGTARAILDGWDKGSGGTAFTTLTGEVSLADGIATIGHAAIDTPELSLGLAGNADLLRKALDLSATVKQKQASGATTDALPVPVVIKGPWGAPRIYPDVPDILMDPAAGYAKLKAMAPQPGD